MNWNDFLLNNDDIVGKKVWITDIRLSDGNAFIRHVPPQEVMIFSNTDLPKNKRVYYSNYHFRKLNSKGEPLKQIIAPYDNTGYRSYTGVSVRVFNNEEDALDEYNSMIDKVIEEYEGRIAVINKHIEDVKSLIVL